MATDSEVDSLPRSYTILVKAESEFQRADVGACNTIVARVMKAWGVRGEKGHN